VAENNPNSGWAAAVRWRERREKIEFFGLI